MRSVVEMQFADFVTCGFNQIVNNLAKTHYRWGQEVNVTVRMPTGAGVRGGPFHSQSTEGWFMQVPGVKVVFPSNPFDAKGMLLAAISDPNPVLFFEHKFLYRSSKLEVPEGFYTVPIGPANVVRSGFDLTIITYGLGVRWALDAVERHSTIDFEILDLRTLLPLDVEAIEKSVKKTGKVLVLTEPPGFAGPAAEILSVITERCFSWLDAPPVRLGSLFTPIPFAAEREDFYLAVRLLDDEIIKLNAY
jgi:2-oxoisovalerate dehydrogenase E1 component